MKAFRNIMFSNVVLLVAAWQAWGSEPTPLVEPRELVTLREEFQRRLNAAVRPINAEYDAKIAAARKPVDTWYVEELGKLEKQFIPVNLRLAALVKDEAERLQHKQLQEIELSVVRARVKGNLRRSGDVLEMWSDPKAEVFWDNQGIAPGSYAVYVTYGSSGGGAFNIMIGGELLKGEVSPTGDWNTYETRPVGEITLLSARNIPIQVSTVSIKGTYLWNLKNVLLKRTK